MKLLFLSKRSPMERDLVASPYGRFYYLPRYLAERGHEVTLLLLDYRNGEPLDRHRDGIRWISEPLARRSPGSALKPFIYAAGMAFTGCLNRCCLAIRSGICND